MSFDFSAMQKQMEEIAEFANKVAETKKLADELAENFAKMKLSINQTINDSFTEIANQIDTLRKNMEMMESIKASAPKVEAPAPEAAPPESEIAPEPSSSSRVGDCAGTRTHSRSSGTSSRAHSRSSGTSSRAHSRSSGTSSRAHSRSGGTSN
jgi:hypothetical protein